MTQKRGRKGDTQRQKHTDKVEWDKRGDDQRSKIGKIDSISSSVKRERQREMVKKI